MLARALGLLLQKTHPRTFINIKAVRDAGLEALENGQAVGYETGAGQNGRPSVIKLTVF